MVVVVFNVSEGVGDAHRSVGCVAPRHYVFVSDGAIAVAFVDYEVGHSPHEVAG
jgi:hypothetical protein